MMKVQSLQCYNTDLWRVLDGRVCYWCKMSSGSRWSYHTFLYTRYTAKPVFSSISSGAL